MRCGFAKKKCAEEVLQRFGMRECRPVSTPAVSCVFGESKSDPVDKMYYQEISGCLIFISTGTRPEISTAVNLFTCSFSNPTERDLTAAKPVLRYLRGKSEFGLRLNASRD